ncbi:hypothetical protein [Streptomyces sp. NPDC096339]|uniref:hypothetical protein n=1 Tax=Streptomyces sp. NPDC096339 TaxID=3366086 RepID=UPI00381797A2
MLLSHTDDGIPCREGISRSDGGESETKWLPLSPAQSAALLRDRHLQFLYRPDPVFMEGGEENMAAVGLPLLGHITLDRNLKNLLEQQNNPSMTATAKPDHGVVATAQAIRQYGAHQ